MESFVKAFRSATTLPALFLLGVTCVPSHSHVGLQCDALEGTRHGTYDMHPTQVSFVCVTRSLLYVLLGLLYVCY